MKKVLFITTSFYPDPYVGSVRAKEFCRWLPEFGWKPYVLTKDYGHRVSDAEFVSAVNKETEVRYLNKFDSEAITDGAGANGIKANAISFLGKYFLAPDVSVLFWRKQAQKILDLVDEINPDVVVTTGPPHSIHSVGIAVKKHRPDVAWIADFRDVFRGGKGYRASVLTYLWHLVSWKFEKKVYKSADGLVFAIPSHYRWVRLKMPSCEKKSRIILNGPPFDLDPRKLSRLCGEKVGPLNITVIGFNNAPESLVLAKSISRLDVDCSLKFIGPKPPASHEIEQVLGESVEFLGPLPHNIVMEEIKKAHVLVAVLSGERSRRIGITSKMFEYLVMPVPILLLNPTRPDSSIFSKHYGVFVRSNPSVNEVSEILIEAFKSDGKLCLDRAIFCYRQWNRKKQALSLVNVIRDLL